MNFLTLLCTIWSMSSSNFFLLLWNKKIPFAKNLSLSLKRSYKHLLWSRVRPRRTERFTLYDLTFLHANGQMAFWFSSVQAMLLLAFWFSASLCVWMTLCFSKLLWLFCGFQALVWVLDWLSFIQILGRLTWTSALNFICYLAPPLLQKIQSRRQLCYCWSCASLLCTGKEGCNYF